MMDFASKIRNIPDYPHKGIQFKDITTLLKDGAAYRALINAMADSVKRLGVNVIVGPEARGFVIGAPLAYALGVGFVPVRKPGKLPADYQSYSYDLEYGTDSLQIHTDAIQPGQRVVLADDLLATGGTAYATAKLIERLGGDIVAVRFAIELTHLAGREKLWEYDVETWVAY